MKKYSSRSVLTAFIYILPFLFISAVLFATLPQWWIKINFENTPMSWLQSSIMSISSFVCFLCFVTFASKTGTLRSRQPMLFLLIAMAFSILSVDESFQIHERIRGGVLIPHHIGTSIPFIGCGDLVLPFYLLCGVFVSYFFLKTIESNRKASTLFKCGFLFAICAISVDTFEIIPKTNIPAFRVLQFTEEFLELLSQTTFLACFADIAFCMMSGERVCRE